MLYPLPQIQNQKAAQTGVVQWLKCQPASQKVAGSIPGQGTGLDCGPGGVREATE